MNILIVGNGGREHALAWKIKQSPRCEKLFVAPGNGGTAEIAENVAIAADDFPSLAEFCLAKSVAMLVVGPEVPLVNGIRDFFESDDRYSGIMIVGPGKSGARLEGSKDFSKQFMVRHNIPTARAKTFHAGQVAEALQYVSECQPPVVLKADGLASGKGVIISASVKEAQIALREMLEDRKFGDASAKVLVEEFLDGIEMSVFVLTDGKDYVVLPEAKDYKRIGEGDTGLNTGGMGAVSPVIFATTSFMKKVEDRVIRPTITGLQQEKIPYQGFIFIGLINVKGEPFVIEYNARLGDPETEAVLPRIKNDLVDLFEATATGSLRNCQIEQENFCAVTVMLVSGGYPEAFQTGKLISGPRPATDAWVFHAGTRKGEAGTVTAGGRVIAVTGKGSDIQTASKNAYEAISGIGWDNLYFRKDIGVDLQNWKD